MKPRQEGFRRAIYEDIARFLEAERERSIAFQRGPMTVYCRKSMRICGPCFDIANISTAPSRQQQGFGTAFIETAELAAWERERGIFVELVGPRHLRNLLERLGYGKVGNAYENPSYVKPYRKPLHAPKTGEDNLPQAE